MSRYAFLSYSRADRAYVERLVTHLGRAGVPVWFDHQMPSGSRFDRYLEGRIQQCGVFLVVMTPAGFESDWVANELARAMQLRKPILPLLLSGQPFISLSSRDYENVLGGTMPSPRFTRTLRTHLEQGSGASHAESWPSLSTQSLKFYHDAWEQVQIEFVDHPVQALDSGEKLANRLLTELGLPTGGDDKPPRASLRAEQILGHYQAVRAIRDWTWRGQTTHVDLRQALIHLRALFGQLLTADH